MFGYGKVISSHTWPGSVDLSAGIQSAGDSVSETLWVRILHSAEEDNLSPLDSKIACICQSIEINNNKQYRKSHCGDKMVLWPSYLCNGISYTDKTTNRQAIFWTNDD